MLGSYANSTATQHCWRLSLELSQKAGYVMPRAFMNQNWPQFISSGATSWRLLFPICENCIDLTFQFGDLGLNYTQTLTQDPEIIVYNIAYHMGLIYEDVVYLSGSDILGDEDDALPTEDTRARYF